MGDMFDGESSTPTRFAVLCPEHGRVYLREEEYRRQMSKPDSRWACPRMDSKPVGFGLCGAESEFDDLTYEPDPVSPETE